MTNLTKLANDYNENRDEQIAGGLGGTMAGSQLVNEAAKSPVLQEFQRSRQQLAAHNLRGMGVLGVGGSAYLYGANQVNRARSGEKE